MSIETIRVHRLKCDCCHDNIEDFGENQYYNDMRKWAREIGWIFSKNKDYCPECAKLSPYCRERINN